MKGSPITQDVFRKAKTMLDAGMKKETVADIMGISVNSVRRIEISENYEQHKENVSAFRKGGKKPEEPKPTAADYYQTNRVIEELRQQREQLAQCVGYMRECAKAFSELLDLLR